MKCPACKTEMKSEQTHRPEHKNGVPMCDPCFNLLLQKKLKVDGKLLQKDDGLQSPRK